MKGTIGPTVFLVIPLLMSLASASPQVNPQKRVSIAFAGADPLEVFGMLARDLNCEVALDKQVSQMITVRAHGVTQQTALDVICESIRCGWRVENGQLVIEPLAKLETSGLSSRSTPLMSGLDKRMRSNMRFENVPLRFVLEDVFKFAAVGYSLFGETASESKLVTIDLSNERVADALTKILENAGLKDFKIMQTVDDSPGSYFIFIPPAGQSLK